MDIFLNEKLKSLESELLGRTPECVFSKHPEIADFFKGKTVLITGGGGSVGRELCRKLALLSPEKIIAADICEHGLFELDNEFKALGFEGFYPEVVSVTNEKLLDRLFEKYTPDIVYHAAAHKHVPLMESCPCEAVFNNVFGTQNAALCAKKHGASLFMLISTDKAIRPVSVMGATKRLCERVIFSQDAAETVFSCARFGNVLFSDGSALPLFAKQILKGEPITLTHPECTRYFMSLGEAAELLIASGSMASKRGSFILDMGEPVGITNMSSALMSALGRKVDVVYTGLRPGERLHEELLLRKDGAEKTPVEKIYFESEASAPVSLKALKELRLAACEGDEPSTKSLLQKLVPEYIPASRK